MARWITLQSAVEEMPLNVFGVNRQSILEEALVARVVEFKDVPDDMKVKHLVMDMDGARIELLAPDEGILVDSLSLRVWIRNQCIAAFGQTHHDDDRPVDETVPKTDRSFADEDAHLLEKMKTLLDSRQARSITSAAGMVAPEASGGGTEDSKKRRLQRSYKAKFGS